MEYTRERDKIGAEERAAGTPPRPFPSGSVIQNRFPTWDAALIAAGLPPAQGRRYPARANGRRGGPRVTDHEVFAAICEAYAKVGDPFTVNAYQAWRRRLAGSRCEPGRRAAVPAACATLSEHSFCYHLAAWRTCKYAMFPRTSTAA
jgi:hypothetical protein